MTCFDCPSIVVLVFDYNENLTLNCRCRLTKRQRSSIWLDYISLVRQWVSPFHITMVRVAQERVCCATATVWIASIGTCRKLNCKYPQWHVPVYAHSLTPDPTNCQLLQLPDATTLQFCCIRVKVVRLRLFILRLINNNNNFPLAANANGVLFISRGVCWAFSNIQTTKTSIDLQTTPVNMPKIY